MAIHRRHGLLVLVAGLHLAMLACWRVTAPRTQPLGQQREGELVFLTQVAARQPKEAAQNVSAAARPPRRKVSPQPVPVVPSAPPSASTPPPAAEAPEPAIPDPFAQPAPVVESVLERSRHAAIGIDRQLRKESKNDNDRVLVHESKLSQDMALAYKGSGAFSMTETVLPNGDSLARVTTPLGSYCMLKRGNRDHAGLNAVNNAGKTLIVRCPK
ncbi:hypothetical protein GM658_25190 [Pseudoduganella eburnea]|uniref:Uncharacterized protein n=1 Tax=Massilia eburnea TaxID=1776165 RepID=A0A6L6QQU3_9BURK|nr:hypothetical protein [Massilia eburnea]MTW13913.1 hypothetical protein [Massilia eburnea]